jgi:hypothetical protein
MKNPAVRIWLTAFAAALLLYAATAHRGAQSQDSGWQQVRIVTGEVWHQNGLVLTHPLHHYLGRAIVRLLPFIEPALAITLISALAAAIAVANVAMTIHVVTRNAVAAIFGATALALSHTFWQQATHTESYALTAALLTGEWLCMAEFLKSGKTKFILALGLCNGLGISNHMLASLATPVDICFVLWAWRGKLTPPRIAGGAVCLWVVGAALYAGVVVAAYLKSGDLMATIRSALVGDFATQVLNTHLDPRKIGFSLGYVFYNFPGLAIPLAAYAVLKRKRLTGQGATIFVRILFIEFIIYALFVARYSIVDQYTFFFPLYLIIAMLAGLGLSLCLTTCGDSCKRTVTLVAIITACWTPIVYETTARVLAQQKWFASLVGNKPYRDGYRTLFIPWGVGENAEENLWRDVVRLAGENGLLLIIDRYSVFNLEYERARGRLPKSVESVFVAETAPPEKAAELRALLEPAMRANRPIILIPRDRDVPQVCVAEAQWRREGDLYVLTGFAN